MAIVSKTLQQQLQEFRQEHLVQWWDELDGDKQDRLISQLAKVDFRRIAAEFEAAQSDGSNADTSRIDRAGRPGNVVRHAAHADNAAEIGESALREGRVAVILVAGGQGSRLGFDHPKGMFPIGPITDRTLFQIFSEQLRARIARSGQPIPWLIMTSPATHDETVQFFESNNFFELPASDVRFFCQGTLPAMDAANGGLLLESKSSLALSPDGHGGLVGALANSGLLANMRDRGIDTFYYHQVDNPTAIVCDPAFLGEHLRLNADMSVKVVEKASPDEPMGVVADVDGRIQIIEYTELSSDQSAKKDDDDEWIFWAGSMAIHAFSLDFLEQLAEGDGMLPLHVARKKVPHINEAGKPVVPSEPNAFKLERFIFDALPLADRVLVFEADRAREFNPVKNAEGSDSPATAREALLTQALELCRKYGIPIEDDEEVEVSPLISAANSGHEHVHVTRAK